MPKRSGGRSDRSKLKEARIQIATVNSQLASANSCLRHYEEVLAAIRGKNDEALKFERAKLERAYADQDFYRNIADQLTLDLDTARTQIRQLQALATVMAVRGVGDLAPAEAAAILSEGAAYCELNADDVLAGADAVLPEAYRLSAKASLELATAPALLEILDVLREMRVRPAQV